MMVMNAIEEINKTVREPTVAEMIVLLEVVIGVDIIVPNVVLVIGITEVENKPVADEKVRFELMVKSVEVKSFN